ncbi:MAG: ABC transporter permease [Rhodospirillaceae bacterium]
MTKLLPLLWAGLWRKPLRTFFTVGALVAAFTVLGLVKGAERQLDNMAELGKMNKMWVMNATPTPMPVAYVQQIQELPGVTYVQEQNINPGYVGEPTNRIFVGGSEERVFEFFPHFKPDEVTLSKWRSTRNGAIMVRQMAEGAGLTVGQNFPFTIGRTVVEMNLVGIIDRTDLPLSVFSLGHYDFFNEYRPEDRKNTADQILVMIEDPEKGYETARAIDAMFTNSAAPTRTQLDYVRMASRAASFGDVKTFVNLVAGVTLAALLLLTTNTMLQSFRERVPEFAVLKTMGFSDAHLVGLLVGEALVQFMAGAIGGLFLARYASSYVRELPWAPGPIFAVPWSVYAVGLSAAVVLALATAAVPVWKLSRLEIAQAMRD